MDFNESISINVGSFSSDVDNISKVGKTRLTVPSALSNKGMVKKAVKHKRKFSKVEGFNRETVSDTHLDEQESAHIQYEKSTSSIPHATERFKTKKSNDAKNRDDFPENGIEQDTKESQFRARMLEKQPTEPVKEILFSTEEFKALPIHPFTVSNLNQNMNINKLTMVQKLAIPTILSGVDVLVRSQTGSGKTLAYAVPIIEALQKIRPKLSRKDGVHALIIVPTRELALQTYEVFVKLLKPFTWIVPGCLMGGEKRKSEKARLRKGITILVGTPGRLLDHANKTRALRFDRTSWLVVDEADRLFELGYERDINALLQLLDDHRKEYELCYGAGYGSILRQSVLLSATLTPAVKNLSNLALRDPTYIETAEEGGTEVKKDTDITLPSTLSQYFMMTPAKLRLVSLIAFIVCKCQFSEERKIIVFCGTQDMVDFHTDIFSVVLNDTSAAIGNISSEDDISDEESESNSLKKKKKLKTPLVVKQDEEEGALADIDVFRLHGHMSQQERTEVFKTFRSASRGVLFCTDVASRGLDLTLVDWVVQLSPPQSVSHYAHRVGRSARVGAHGSALLFLVDSELEFVERLHEARISLEEQEMSTYFEYLKMAVNASPRWKSELETYLHKAETVAVGLQHSLEDIVLNDEKLKQKACKAYTSWMRFYSSYPKEVRSIFNMKRVHPGHFASSFALRMAPSQIVRCSKGLPTTPLPPRPKKTHSPVKRPQQPKSTVSEYDSGLPAIKKRRKSGIK
ncbi:probable ATP-dependent RNA helicase DDX31 [Schistocerca nitens]|uniref:probable ATP-dependent RNA helicase DDX31 n=1 Tax=Schistocerca nitens TaxID=7011 RepID=UPI0021188226|nr:probable ATP-dependent RNA helicase DDX31 [Schistocerca nitens]